MTRQLHKKNYYYAGGRRIALTPAMDLLAVDDQHQAVRKLSAEDRAELEGASQPLGGSIRLVHPEALEPNTRSLLQQSEAFQPVFRAQKALLVPLPEVRVEESRPTAQDRLEKWLQEHSHQVIVRSQGMGRMVLEPVSGHGEDALALANALAEEVKPEMAQARFIRVTERPSTMK